MSHWITLHPESGINCQVQTTSINQLHLQVRQQSDEAFKDIKAIAELEPSGIVHIAVLFPFQNCKFYGIRRHSLTRMSASCTKTPIHRQSLNQYKFTCPYKLPLFSLFCFVLWRTSNVHFLIYAFDIKLLIHKYLHMKQKINCRWHRKQGQCEVVRCSLIALSAKVPG